MMTHPWRSLSQASALIGWIVLLTVIGLMLISGRLG